MAASHLPYIDSQVVLNACVHCNSSNSAASQKMGQVYAQPGCIVHGLTPDAYQQKYGCIAPWSLFQWSCSRCGGQWSSYTFEHDGRLDDSFPTAPAALRTTPMGTLHRINTSVSTTASDQPSLNTSYPTDVSADPSPVNLQGGSFDPYHAHMQRRLNEGMIDYGKGDIGSSIGPQMSHPNDDFEDFMSQSGRMQHLAHGTSLNDEILALYEQPFASASHSRSASQTDSGRQSRTSSRIAHKRGDNFDPQAFQYSREHGVCDFHRKQKRKCDCDLEYRRKNKAE